MTPIRYFKRYRMVLDLARPLPPVPLLPDGYFWLPWADNLVAGHARAKHASFHAEIDSQVFPSLATEFGCEQLMRAIRLKPGFLPGATWLLACGPDYCGTVQGVRERSGNGGIQNLGVSPAHRGRGLGTALLLQALHGFRRVCLPGAVLEVTAENAAAVRIYRRLGFRCRKTVYKAVETAVFALVAEEPVPG
jgi:ribosomal protein S18 acetylase RimI-like enzyme